MMKIAITILLLMSFYVVNAQNDNKESLNKLNQETTESFKNGKLDKALISARKAVDLSIKIYGAESRETAKIYTNIGIIYRENKQYKESIENLQKAVSIYRGGSKVTSAEKIDALELLAFSQTLDGKTSEAETNYLQAIKLAEDSNGVESKQSFSSTLNLANLYVRENKIDQADEMYLKSYAVAIKNFGREAKEIERIEDERSCLIAFKNFNFVKFKNFYDERAKRFGELIEQGGSINSKTKNLMIPKVPEEARRSGVGGTVLMRVRVDENGKVFEAKSICATSPFLVKEPEEAAINTKFEKLSVNGKIVKYSGILFYKFFPKN